MPRPKRARRAPVQSAKAAARSATPEAEDHSDNELPHQNQSPERGRTRTTRASGARLSAADERAILAVNKRRDAALDKLANEDPTSTAANNEDEDSGSSVEGGRRVTATPAQRRDTTGLDLADSVFGDLDDSFEDDNAPQGMRSTDTSSLNLSNFKRRPRQSSIIGRNDPPIRPSSRGGNTPSISSSLQFGAFKRRAREPSILGTARKARPDDSRLDDTGVEREAESGSESEEEFLPEAESTPLNNRRRTQPNAELELEREPAPEVPAESRSRKRKSEDALPSSDRPEKMSRVGAGEEDESEGEREDVNEADEIDDGASHSSLSSISSPLFGPSPSLLERPVTPVNNEEIMAPPASSDSEEANEVWPDIHALAKRRRRPSFTTPVRADNFSDVSSPPSLTHSPNYAETRAPKTRGRAATRRQPSPKITTADLTSLLPKRRYKKPRDPLGLESDGEYDTSGLAEDEDELSYLDSRAARRRQGSRPPSRGAAARPGSRGGRTEHALKPRQPTSSKPATRNTQTYSRRSSDKENEGEEEDNDDELEHSHFQPLPDNTFENESGETSSTPSADELKQAARKFKEVDRWELDFEEVTQSSSPQGAR
ncbi:hypothetical protein FDECE_5874 [Fusarium decemcellulare]|nr:hypothetical protein FDECE_5874 [Fusarium decemcellulare]